VWLACFGEAPVGVLAIAIAIAIAIAVAVALAVLARYLALAALAAGRCGSDVCAIPVSDRREVPKEDTGQTNEWERVDRVGRIGLDRIGLCCIVLTHTP
jgi:hypothetical protein